MLTRTFRILLISSLFFSFFLSPAFGCVGRILYVGSLETVEDKVMAELLVLLINERTGTTVKIRYFDRQDELYNALKSNDEDARVDIIVEDTTDALAVLKKTAGGDLDTTYRQVKELYESELGLVWLNAFGFTGGSEDAGKSLSAPLVRRDILTNYPLLPRVLNKLAGAINDEAYVSLVDKVRSGDKPRNVSKDFLRAKKFI